MFKNKLNIFYLNIVSRKRYFSILLFLNLSMFCIAQNIEGFDKFREDILSSFNQERQNIFKRYNSYRDSINDEYSKFLKEAWGDYSLSSPMPRPKEDNLIPPIPYDRSKEDKSIDYNPKTVPIINNNPKPQPIEPIKENPSPIQDIFNFSFYGINEGVRHPSKISLNLNVNDNLSIAKAWEVLYKDSNLDNTLYDLLKIRDKYNLCDWSFLQLLNEFSNNLIKENNVATLLTSFLFFQSGYQMRLAHDNSNLFLLYGSQHHIYEKPYYVVDGLIFYPYTDPTTSLNICKGSFENETPLSLLINSEQKLGSSLSEQRLIKSKRYSDLSAISQVPIELIQFFNSYPTSAIGSNLLSRWAMYANTPLSQNTKDILYSSLKQSISDCTQLEAANKLLNWVQTGFVYEYDDKVWGHDRAFFAEETLYYPYADCEDRSILFSRLIRDLLDLDVALIYYPGHLATAVKFDTDVRGDAMIVNGEKYIICDPTFIGAPVGSQMPNLEYDKAQAIILKR